MNASIQPAVHLIPVGYTNAYALDGGDGVVLIDTGVDSPENWDALASGLRGAGLRLADVKLVLLTHAHFDHSGLAGRVRAETGARVLVHPDDIPLLSARGGSWGQQHATRQHLLRMHGVPDAALRWFDQRLHRSNDWREDFRRQLPIFDRAGVFQPDAFADAPAPAAAPAHHKSGETQVHQEVPPWDRDPIAPDATFQHDEVIERGALKVRVLHTPGHTPGHACFALDDQGLLFTGDHVLKRTVPTAGAFFEEGQVQRRMRALPAYLRSLRSLYDLDVARVLPAHEEEIADLPKAVERIVRNYERRTAQVLRAVAGGAATAFDVLPQVFPITRPAVLWPTMVEVIGHLDVLEESGAVVAAAADGQVRYRVPATALA